MTRADSFLFEKAEKNAAILHKAADPEQTLRGIIDAHEIVCGIWIAGRYAIGNHFIKGAGLFRRYQDIVDQTKRSYTAIWCHGNDEAIEMEKEFAPASTGV